jgi:hypothetical protein
MEKDSIRSGFVLVRQEPDPLALFWVKQNFPSGTELSSCSAERLSRSFKKRLKASWIVQRSRGWISIMSEKIALMPGAETSRCCGCSQSITRLNQRSYPHIKPFQEGISQLIDIRGERVVVCGTRGFRGDEIAVVFLKRLRGDSNILGISPV